MIPKNGDVKYKDLSDFLWLKNWNVNNFRKQYVDKNSLLWSCSLPLSILSFCIIDIGQMGILSSQTFSRVSIVRSFFCVSQDGDRWFSKYYYFLEHKYHQLKMKSFLAFVLWLIYIKCFSGSRVRLRSRTSRWAYNPIRRYLNLSKTNEWWLVGRCIKRKAGSFPWKLR